MGGRHAPLAAIDALIQARELTLPLEDLRVAHIADQILAADGKRRNSRASDPDNRSWGVKVRIFSSALRFGRRGHPGERLDIHLVGLQQIRDQLAALRLGLRAGSICAQ